MTLKTNKSITKRFKITKNKKVLFRPAHQNHYNAKDSGDETRRKRKSQSLKGTIKKRIINKS
jgi:ribosomal protein L35